MTDPTDRPAETGRPENGRLARGPLSQALEHYQTHERRRFHMPGHMGRSLVDVPGITEAAYRSDLTELDGLDVLSEPEGRIQESQQQAAKTFGAARSFFLVNGASVGIQAAMLAGLKPGNKVLLPRNVHRSVLSGLIITGAEPIWLLPDPLPDWGIWGAVNPETVEGLLRQYPDVKALVIASPTYEGIGSDTAALSAICRKHGALFIVDEAHGSLWPLSERLPDSALNTDCDAVIHSLHKAAGSLTQSAIAHLPTGSRVDPERYQQALNTLHTTSPSYLLLASLDATVAFLGSDAGRRRIDTLLDETRRLRDMLDNRLRHFRLLSPVDTERLGMTKLYLTSPDESGESWGYRMEAKRQLAFEAVSPYGVLYQCGIGLSREDADFFIAQFAAEDAGMPETSGKPAWQAPVLPRISLTPREAFFAPGERLPKRACAGRISRETVVHCPPGIPVLMPGEVIAADQLPLLPDTVDVVV